MKQSQFQDYVDQLQLELNELEQFCHLEVDALFWDEPEVEDDIGLIFDRSF